MADSQPSPTDGSVDQQQLQNHVPTQTDVHIPCGPGSWFGAGLTFSQVGVACLVASMSCTFVFRRPWLVFFLTGLACFLVHSGRTIWHGGLLALLPASASEVLTRTPFQLMRQAITSVTRHGCNLTRVVMLASMDLDEKQHTEIVSGIDDKFYQDLVQRPLLQQLPWPLRRLLIGTGDVPDDPSAWPRLKSTEGEPAPEPLVKATVRAEEPTLPEAPAGAKPLRKRRTDQQGKKELVRLADGSDDGKRMGDTTEKIRAQQTLQKVLHEKMMDTAVEAVKNCSMRQVTISIGAVRSVILWAYGTTQHMITLLLEQCVGVLQMAAGESDLRAAIVAGIMGFVGLGFFGGLVGLVLGAWTGGLLGLLAALLTFGFSVPAGAFIGGVIGLFIGASVGSMLGVAGGGVAGYCLRHFDRRGGLRGKIAECNEAGEEDDAEGYISDEDSPES